MEMDVNDRRGSAGFPVDQPMQALRMDHDFVRKLFDRYLTTEDVNIKKEAGPQILLLLQMHAALEETVFYPRVQEADASLVDICEDDHRQVRQMIERLRMMEEGDPQTELMFRQLADAVLQHIEIEEQQLFPKVEQANLDLAAIGLEMQAFETSILTGQVRAMEQKDIRA